MQQRTLLGLATAGAVALLPLAACTSQHTEAKRPGRPTRASATAAAPAKITATLSTPELDSGETLAARRNATSGSADIEFGKGRKSDALIVAVSCQGTGRIRVTVRPVHVSFPLTCTADKVNTTYNQLAVKGADRSGTVAVQAPTGVHWSMTVARGDASQEESPGTGT